MKVVINMSGEVIYSEQDSIFSRSNAVNKVELYSPYSPLDLVIVNFRREDNVQPMSRYMAYTGIDTMGGTNYYVYRHDFSAYQLSVVGELEMSCRIVMFGGEEILSTGTFYATIEDGGNTNLELQADEESDFLTLTQAVENRAVLQPLAISGNFASIDEDGQYVDSGVAVTEVSVNSIKSIADTAIRENQTILDLAAGKTYVFDVTIPTSAWNAQTKTAQVSVAGVTSAWTITVCPSASSMTAFLHAGGVYCTGIGTGTMNFECTYIPTDSVVMNCVGGVYSAIS